MLNKHNTRTPNFLTERQIMSRNRQLWNLIHKLKGMTHGSTGTDRLNDSYVTVYYGVNSDPFHLSGTYEDVRDELNRLISYQ